MTISPTKRDWADNWAYWGFNLLLVGVGALQVLLLCRTLRFVRRQAEEATRQRVVMRGQLRTMRGQLAQMEASGTQTNSLIEQAKNHAIETEKIAKGTLDQIELIKNKERTRLAIDFKAFRWERVIPEYPVKSIDFEISIDGTTSATVLDTHLRTGTIHKEQMQEFDDLTGKYLPDPIHKMPSRILPQTPPFQSYANVVFSEDDAGEAASLEGIQKEMWIVFVSGYIRYQDIFDKIWIRRFRRYWGRTDRNSILSSIGGWSDIEVGKWIPFGPPEENQETAEPN